MLPVIKVLLSSRPGYHVLAIGFSRALTLDEELELCQSLTDHLVKNEVFLLREFGECEIHFRPSPKSAALFFSLPEAIEEYQLLLKSLGLDQHTIIVHGNLLPLKERESAEKP